MASSQSFRCVWAICTFLEIIRSKAEVEVDGSQMHGGDVVSWSKVGCTVAMLICTPSEVQFYCVILGCVALSDIVGVVRHCCQSKLVP